MRHRRIPWTKWAALGLPTALLLASPAAANEPTEEPTRTKRAAEILAHMDSELEVKPSPFTRFGLTVQHGLTYRHTMELQGRRVELRVNGPVRRHDTWGLKFKIKF